STVRPRTTCPRITICSTSSSTAATTYGSNGSGDTYGAGGLYRASAYDQIRPRVENRYSASSEPSLGPAHCGFRQARVLRGKYGVPQVVQRLPFRRTVPSSAVNQSATAGRCSF